MAIPTSRIVLYQCDIIPQRNAVVESISDYLMGKAVRAYENYQYIKENGNALDFKIKIVLGESYFNQNIYFNYLSIKNSDSSLIFYYFVMKVNWLSTNTCEVEVSCDTLNTFQNYIKNFTDRTKVMREHRDRLKINNITGSWIDINTEDFEDGVEYRLNQNLTSWIQGEFSGVMKLIVREATTENSIVRTYDIDSVDFSGTVDFMLNGEVVESLDLDSPFGPYWYSVQIISYSGSLGSPFDNFDKEFEISKLYLTRIIDKTSEGINPLLYGRDTFKIQDDSPAWYLVYKNDTAGYARLYACSENETTEDFGASNVITASDLVAGRYYFISTRFKDNGVYIDLGGATSGASINVTDSNGIMTSCYTGIMSNYATLIRFYKDGSNIVYRILHYDGTESGVLGGYPYPSYESEDYTVASLTLNLIENFYYSYSSQYYSNLNSIIDNTTLIAVNITGITNVIAAIGSVDRYDQTLIKIIKIPYRPVPDFTSWKYDSTQKMPYLDNLNKILDYGFTISENPLSELFISLDSSPAKEQEKDIARESKLYHSDYYQNKFIYDSFSLIFQLELVDIDSYIPKEDFNIIFSITNTINSNMLFTFPDYELGANKLQDYSGILYVSRNNECIIYNSDYINYLKSGFNYDKKSKERSEAVQWIGFGVSLAGSIASFAASAYTGGVSAAAGIALATSAVTQAVGAVNSTVQAESNMEKQLYQLQHQKDSVFGADDVDIMTRYTGDKAKLMNYTISEKMKNNLYNLFNRCGYIVNEYKIPNTDNRMYFNFVQCSPDWTLTTLKNVPINFLEDINIKFEAGVTFYHKYESKWDLYQEYENWERSLL